MKFSMVIKNNLLFHMNYVVTHCADSKIGSGMFEIVIYGQVRKCHDRSRGGKLHTKSANNHISAFIFTTIMNHILPTVSLKVGNNKIKS